MSDKRYLRRAIGPDFALDANYILDTIGDMINQMQEKVGKDFNHENAVFLIGPVLLRTLKWAAPTQYKCIKVIEDSHQYNNRQQIILEYEEEDMPYGFFNGRSNGKGYTLEQDFKAIWGVSSFSGVEPTKVIFNGPATIVFWSDKTKTIVKRADNELDDKEKALAMCLLKKNKKLFKFCRKEAAKQEAKECEDIHDMVERFLNALTGGKNGK